MASVPLDLAHHPTHVVLDLGYTWSLGDNLESAGPARGVHHRVVEESGRLDAKERLAASGKRLVLPQAASSSMHVAQPQTSTPVSWNGSSTCPTALFFFTADMVDMMFVMENEARKKKERMKPKYASPVACLSKQLSSSGHFVMMKELCHRTGTCKWLSFHDESEWSLMTSLIRRFWFPYEQSAGRSLREMCRS